MRSARNVVDEMKICYDLGIREIEIMDDTFSFSRERVMEICDLLIHYKANRLWKWTGTYVLGWIK